VREELRLRVFENRVLRRIFGPKRDGALENSDDDENVNRTWENIKENIQTSAKESLGLDEF